MEDSGVGRPGSRAVGMDAPASISERISELWPLVGRDDELRSAARALSSGRGVVLCGLAGSGKTRLALEIRAAAQTMGLEVVHAVATESAAGVPLGAFGQLLDEPDSRDGARADQLRRVATSLRSGVGDSRLLVSVDDAHNLDDLSAALLMQMASGGEVQVLLTQRVTEPAPPELLQLWKDGHCDRIEVSNLSREEAHALLVGALGGPVDRKCSHQLYELCEGNPLHLRELLLTAHDHGVLESTDGVWRTGRLPEAAPRLASLVGHRLARLPADLRETLELVASAEGQGLGFFEKIANPGALESLERQGLVSIGLDGRRHCVRMAHPLHGEVVRAQIARVRRASVHRLLADRLTELGARRRDDVVPLAIWRIEGGGEVNSELTTAAALQAYYSRDDALAERLARAAILGGGGHEARWVLGVSLVEQGRRAEADEELARIPLGECDDDLLVRAANARAENYFWGLGDRDAAQAVLREGIGHTEDPAISDHLIGVGAAYDLMAGEPLAVLSNLGRITEGGDGRENVIASLISAPALVLIGHTDEALEAADRGIQIRLAHLEDPNLSEVGLLMMARCHALTEAGRLSQALVEAEAGYSISLESGTTLGQAWFALKRARALLFSGRVRSADEWFAEAGARYSDLGLSGCRRWCVGGRLWAASLMGDETAAASLRDELDGLDPMGVLMMEPEVQRARAAHELSKGSVNAAAEQLLEAAAEAKLRSLFVLEASALHDLCRLGRAELSADRLTELEKIVGGEFVATEAAHARALAGDDSVGLEGAGDRFAEMEANLFGAEAFAEAASLRTRRGEARMASRSAARAAELYQHCEGAQTPALAVCREPVSLTRREREIAMLAAAGRSAKEVADELCISHRTVENHLLRIYSKLGVSNREELAGQLAPSTA